MVDEVGPAQVAAQGTVEGDRWLDVLVSRTLIFVLLTAVVVGVYAVGFTVLGHAVLSNTAMGILLGAVVAALLQPAFRWGTRAVDWLLYGDRADPYRVLVRSAEAVQTQAGGAGLIVALTESLRTALRLTYVRVEDAAAAEVASSGTAARRRYEFPVWYQGGSAGRLTVSRASDVLTGGDRRLLAGVLPLLGAALDSMRRENDLRTMRERLVTVHEEERRRLRRELHDGLGPALAAASLSIDAARTRLRSDPAGGDALLDGVQQDLRESMGEMRRLIDALRPAALDQMGLVAAVRQRAAALGAGSALATEVSGPELTGLSAAAEVAAYRIAVEAVANAVRHSGATRCTVDFTTSGPDALVVTVTDNGAGRHDWPEGVGISSMRERAEELGGTLTLDEPPGGGCLIRARLHPTAVPR
jgi:signal transduction histidine kinase